MDYSYPFDEYQSPFVPFGVDVVPPESPRSFVSVPDGLFGQTGDSSFEVMPDVYLSQDSSVDSLSFKADSDSPQLPTSTSVSESPASGSPLSSPSDNSDEVKVKFEPDQQAAYSGYEMFSIDTTAKSISLAPERKKKRKQEPKTAPKQQGKKRKAQSENSEELNPEYLVQMNSVELESMYHQLQMEGRLKSEDDKLFRKIIRQVKNRESAQISRTRRRDHMDFVEAKLKHQEMVTSYLRDYANQLKGLLVQNGLDVPPEPEIPVFVPPPPSESSLVTSSRSVGRPLRTAGICLMIVVLSVGILFNAMHRAANPANSIQRVNDSADGKIVSESAVDPSARVIVEGNAEVAQLSQTAESNSDLAPDLKSDPKSEPAHNGEVTSLDVIRKSSYLSYQTDKADSSLALVIPDQKQQVPSQTLSVSSLVPATCPVMRYTSKAIFGDGQPRVADRSWSLDNTSYILVNDATEFVPRSVDTNSIQARTEPVIGLLLPASSFNISNTAPDDVVELICGVRNANLVPRSVLAHSLY